MDRSDSRPTHVVGIIPARGGSQGVPRKNLRPLAGQPLLSYTIRAAQAASSLNRVVVSTDCDAIASCAREWQANVFRHPPALSADDAPTYPVIRWALEELKRQGTEPDVCVVLRPPPRCAPLQISMRPSDCWLQTHPPIPS
ncbi:MAG: hypothetical protein JNM56_29325 [Planctomycetia bacterium]|nr:hypothetical protein [Planctomycetia bacterium]